MTKTKRTRKPRTPLDRLHLPSVRDSIDLESGAPKNDSHKVSLGPDSKR